MSLEWKEFERSLRRRALAELKESPSGWKDYCKEKESRGLDWLPGLWWWVGAPLICCFFAWGTMYRNPESVGTILFLILISASSIYYSWFLSSYFHPETQWTFCQFPMSDDQIFKEQTRIALTASLWLLVVSLATFLGMFFKNHSFWGMVGLAILFGVLQWAVLVAMVMSISRVNQLRFFGQCYAFFWLPFIFLQSSNVDFFKRVHAFCSAVCAWIPPLGWCLPPLNGDGGWFRHAFLAGTMLTLFALMIYNFKRIRQMHCFNSVYLEILSSMISAGNTDADREAMESSASKTTSPGQPSKWLAPLNTAELGFFDRFLFRFLTPREQNVLEFAAAGKLNWTSWFQKVALVIVLSIVVLATYGVNKEGLNFVMLMPIGFFGIAAFNGRWQGLETVPGTGYQGPYYAVYPIQFWEIARTVLKVNLIRYLCCLPLLWIVTGLITSHLHELPLDGAATLLKVTFAGMIFQPILVIAPISPSTNDSRGFAFWSCSILLSLGAMIFGLSMMFVTPLPRILFCGAGAVACTFGLLAFYGWLFNHNRFDLLPSKLK